MSRTKYWCVTVNNYDEKFYEDLETQLSTEEGIEGVLYAVIGREGQEEAKTPHLQVYAEFDKRVRMSAVKNIFGNTAHCEKREGTGQQAAEYCKKEGDFLEFGEMFVSEQVPFLLSELF